MDQLTYQYLFTALTLLFWLSPIILLISFSAAYYILKNKKAKKQVVKFAEKKQKQMPMQTVS